MTYYLMIFGELSRDRLVSALATLLSLPVDAIDVGDEDDGDRNWSASVICTVSPLRGELHWHLDLYLSEPIAQRSSEPVVAAGLAQQLRTVVVYPGKESQPSVYWLVGPDGHHVRARIVDNGGEDEPVYRIDAVEHPVAALPDLPLAAITEVIREHRLPVPVSDALEEQLRPWLPAKLSPDTPAEQRSTWHACNTLNAWEDMVARMAAGWPPDGWYPATFYHEDLALRDELARAEQTLPEPVRAPFAVALGEIDRQFLTLTEDDGGAALSAELGDASTVPSTADRWWWHRIPEPPPWQRQPARNRS